MQDKNSRNTKKLSTFYNKRLYSTSTRINTNLLSNWITGFSDGESSFSISISKNNKYKTGWNVVPAFAIELKDIDISLLHRIKEFFGIGKIQIIKNKGHALYVVNSIKDLHDIIIPHFEKYPLLTIKRINFLLFKEIILLMKNKEHLTKQGLQRVMIIRSIMNKKISVSSYTEPLVKIDLPEVHNLSVTDITSEWITGFTDAERCFFINIRSNRNKTGYWITAKFSLVQHSRDTLLFKIIQQYLNCGNLIEENNANVVRLRVENFKLISEKVIPFFINNFLQSSKLANFKDLYKACGLIKQKAHLTEQGIIELKVIKSGMNTGRVY